MKKITAIILLLVSTFFLYRTHTSFVYLEGWSSFYYDKHHIASMLGEGRWHELISGFCLQWYANLWAGIASTIIIGGIISCVLYLLMHYVSRGLKNRSAAFAINALTSVAGTMVILCSMMNYPIARLFDFSRSAQQNELYMQMSNSARQGEWDDIIDVAQQHSPMTNLLCQNILNMALAEKHTLGNALLDQPCQDIRSIYVDDITSEKIAAHLSDIYYSMGHIAQAQRYAFEANEKMGNLSPRMLQTLIKTNILYGNYAVAKKYLRWLKKTIFYHEWASQYSALLDSPSRIKQDDALASKSQCIFPQNRFSGIYGLDDDLLHIARHTKGTPQCLTTLNYLASLYILAGYEKQFLLMYDEFHTVLQQSNQPYLYFEKYYNHLSKQ